MINVTYHMPMDDNAVVTMGGVRFFDGQPVELDETDQDLAHLLSKLAGNRWFEVTEPETKDDGLKAEHHGGGKFNITKGEDVLAKGLTKADADAFNSMTDEEKATYVADLSK